MPDFDSAAWDTRYRGAASVWGRPPNRWVEAEVGPLAPGVALDLACGEGRNAIWLDSLGWQVIAVDFSQVALAKGAVAEQHATEAARITWVLDDVIEFRCPDLVDLIVIAYLQVEPSARRATVRNAARSLAPGGVLLVIAHDSRNLADGTGGPKDPTVLYSALDVAHDLEPTELLIERADEVLRPVDDSQRPAIDALMRARRPGGEK